jgi:DNA-binding CsgD family transcriptional regulator
MNDIQTEILKVKQQYFELLATQKFVQADLDNAKAEKHIALLETISSVQKSAISMFDLYQKKHVYLSNDFATLLGWDIKEATGSDTEYMDNRIHPEDFVAMTKAAIYFLKMAFSMPKDNVEILKSYKFIADYRTKNKEDNYVRIIEQHKALEFDKHGNVWLALAVMDLSPDNDVNTPFRSRLINTLTGEIFLFPTEEEVRILDTKLSLREKEILGMISNGLISKEIADKLYISVNTVNTHRQRILEKLDVTNTAEAIKYAGEIGILN